MPSGQPNPVVTSLDLAISGNATLAGGVTTLSAISNGGTFQVFGGAQGFATLTACGATPQTGPVSQRFDARCVVRDVNAR